jgi:hypothetical protein
MILQHLLNFLGKKVFKINFDYITDITRIKRKENSIIFWFEISGRDEVLELPRKEGEVILNEIRTKYKNKCFTFEFRNESGLYDWDKEQQVRRLKLSPDEKKKLDKPEFFDFMVLNKEIL